MRFFELLDSAHPYLDCFDYDHYPRCFAEFEQRAEAFFRNLNPAAFEGTVEEILSLAEERWKSAPFLERSRLARRDQTALGIFFSPAAARHSETAKTFSELLRESWNSRFPRRRFLAGDYEKIMLGFDKDFFGVKLRKSEKRE